MGGYVSVGPTTVAHTGTITGTANFSGNIGGCSLYILFYATRPALPTGGSSSWPPDGIGNTWDYTLANKNGASLTFNYSVKLSSFKDAYGATKTMPANANFVVTYLRFAGPSNYEGYGVALPGALCA